MKFKTVFGKAHNFEMQLTIDERTFVVERFIQTEDYDLVKAEFRARFPYRNPPANSTIYKNVKKFERHGTTHNLNAGRSGRNRTVRTPANIQRVEAAIAINPRLSARRNGLGISKSAYNEITRIDLNYHPYRMKVRHALEGGDHVRRSDFSQWFLAQTRDPQFFDKVLIGDEAAFAMDGQVYNHNMVYYAEKGNPPEFYFDRNNSREKVTAWAGLCGNGDIMGPFFFDENVTGARYLNMINDDLVPDLMQHFNFNIFGQNLFENNLWWFQDGAPCHGTLEVRTRLRELFGNQVVALNHTVEWPARSPDLTPCDFFLWGYIKSRVYQTPPADVFELRLRIVNEFNLLRNDPAKIRRSVRDMEKRANLCIQRNGGHVEGHHA